MTHSTFHKNLMLPVLTVIICSIMLFTACRKQDLGNYDYTDPNQIGITLTSPNASTSNPDSFAIRQSDTLKITAQVNQTIPSTNLSYNWYIIQNSAGVANVPEFHLGTGSALNAEIKTQPGAYQLVSKVTDNSTNHSFYKIVKFNILPAPWGEEGWVVLQDQSSTKNGFDISVIRTMDGTTPGAMVYNNLYAFSNRKKLPLGTKSVSIIDYSSSVRAQSVLFNYGNGCLQTRTTDFTDSVNLNNMFLTPPATFNYQRILCINQGQREMIFNDNKVYYRKVNVGTLALAPLYFGAPVLGTWTVSPYYAVVSGLYDNYCLFFDEKNGCFFMVDLINNSLLPALPDIPNKHFPAYTGTGNPNPLSATGKGFDLNNISHKLLYAENAQTLQYAAPNVTTLWWDFFFRNTGGDSTFVYQFQSYFSGNFMPNNLTTGRYYLDPVKCPGINTASIFAVPPFLGGPGGVFYYVKDNAINTVVVQSSAATQGSSVVNPSYSYNFPAGTKINTMKVFKSNYSGTSTLPRTPLPANEGRVLAVATDESAIGSGHKVYFFRLGNNGELGSPVSSYTGFDKIVDIAFKKTVGL